MKIQRDGRGCWLVFIQILSFLCMVAIPELAKAATQEEGIDRGVHEKLIEPSIPNEELRSSEKFWEESERFTLIGDVQGYGSYSDLQGDSLWGGSFYGLVAPAYKLGERNLFILMYDGQFDRRQDLYSDDYGFRRRTEFQRHAITPMLRMDFGEGSRYSITPSLNYTRTWNKDGGEDESWDSGLYNYQDVGAGLDFDIREFYGAYGTFKIGVQYYARRYPNYFSLLDLATGYHVEEDEKDYHGIITKLEYAWIKDAGFSWMADYSLLYKNYDDKKLTRSDGYLDTSDEQEDYVHEVNLRFWYSFEDIAGGLKVGLNLNSRIYDSNQNFVKFYNPESWDVNKDYFAYRAYRINPNIAYTFEQIPLTASLSYSYEDLLYTDRWAERKDGSFKYDDHQWETSYEVVMGLKFVLTEKTSLLGQWEHLQARSNNDYESVYLYDYRSNRYLLGARYDF